jgi:SAM-dependent methyltransferase
VTDPASDDERVAGIRQVWTEGDYRRIAQLFSPVSERLAVELDVAGRQVLDAATGTGNTAIAMARAGAEVEAFDLTPLMLDRARERARAEHVQVRFREGDLTAVPFPDASFDLVVSTFGAFLCDDPAACARELVRVCRPGGRIVSTAWTGEGVIGSLRRATESRYPQLAMADPSHEAHLVWGDPDRLPGLFEGCDVEVHLEHREVWFPFGSSEDALELFETTSGPVMRLRGAILEAGLDWDAIRSDLVREWDEVAVQTDAGVELPSTYAVAFVERRS